MAINGLNKSISSNVTSKTAFFTVRGLPSGLSLTINIYAANAKGRSEATVLNAATTPDLTAKHADSGKLLQKALYVFILFRFFSNFAKTVLPH
ncbi:hypothetical protein Pmani_021260 [Petrolisthes manimaculis]|uniref:Uncharacterized protein n=1 Tax=Petrolisthes manimaculis TaxID=1843537 RepID=A0AAE1PH09_9EUCA|nr:hypothetical protein Pmani_021260 [Petrolisthes manimaculis]